MNENFRKGINHFVKMTVKNGYDVGARAQGLLVGFREIPEENAVDILVFPPEKKLAGDFDFTFEFPKLSGDETDKMIELAGIVSQNFVRWQNVRQKSLAGKKSAQNMTPEERSERARKAGKSRWKNREK